MHIGNRHTILLSRLYVCAICILHTLGTYPRRLMHSRVTSKPTMSYIFINRYSRKYKSCPLWNFLGADSVTGHAVLSHCTVTTR